MKILVIEDDIFKREQITDFLEEKNIEYEAYAYVNPALRYILQNKEKISGIILDMGLPSFKDSKDYTLIKGMDIIKELYRKRLYIPVLINSSRDLSIFEMHSFVFGQRTEIGNYQILEDYISFLKQREKQ